MAKLRRSAKKEAQTQGKQPEQSGVVVSGEFSGKKKLPSLPKNKKLLFAAVVVVALVAGGTLFVINKDDAEPTVTKKVETAHDAVLDGDYNAAEQALTEAQKNASTPSDSAKIELGLAEAKANNGKYDEALAHAQKSNEHQESVAAHALIGYVAEQQSNWQLAADSYARAAALSPQVSDPTQQSEYNHYKNLEKEARAQL